MLKGVSDDRYYGAVYQKYGQTMEPIFNTKLGRVVENSIRRDYEGSGFSILIRLDSEYAPMHEAYKPGYFPATVRTTALAHGSSQEFDCELDVPDYHR
ncbi:MAG TPA: hypothetical protein VJB59_08170 [Bdellovibrionota bacterium]|nr:hypothetical protein [Bdellovibrionota bacterium]